MNFFANTYIICHSSLTNKLKNIKNFTLDLGMALTNRHDSKFNPSDVNIQKHNIFHNDIILKIGKIGSLLIYNSEKIKHNQIYVVNDKILEIYTINEYTSLYDNLNVFFEMFLNKHNIKIQEETKPIKIEETKPLVTKPLSEMTKEERILFARSR